MDTRWDHGFFASEEESFQQRLKLQQELEQLSPIPDDDLERAADLLEQFAAHWENLKDKPDDQHELVKLIVDRDYIDGDRVVAMTLRSNYHLVLGNNINGPTERSVDPSIYECGSDGIRTRDLWLDTLCWSLPAHSIDRPIPAGGFVAGKKGFWILKMEVSPKMVALFGGRMVPRCARMVTMHKTHLDGRSGLCYSVISI
jgi:hypothetical protein